MRSFKSVLIALGVLLASSAHAGLSRVDIEKAQLAPTLGAALPKDAVLHEIDGTTRSLGSLITGKPAIVAFIDYTCRTLCGTTVNSLAQALSNVTLKEERDYRVVVIGFNPADGPREAIRFRETHLGRNAIAQGIHFLSTDPATIHRLSRAAGLTVVYDAEHQQYAHPIGFLVTTPQGLISRVINPVTISPFALRLALVATATGQLATVADRVAFLCYGFDAATGIYTLAIWRILTFCCLLTVLVLGTALVILIRREKRV